MVRSRIQFLGPRYLGPLNQSQTWKASSKTRATMITTRIRGDRYLSMTFLASVKSLRSGPVKGVTRFRRMTPLMRPSKSQKIITAILARTRRRKR